MATDTGAIVTKPADVGLKREIGLIGATWASETSIIGSGWLLASFGGAVALGGSAIYAWIIGGVIVAILALVHAELGGMYPVAGGTARFPHLAFGGGAGISFGFFSWLQAVTVAPVECFAVIRYTSHWWTSIRNPTTGNVTHIGFVVVIGLMAIFTAVNFLAMRYFNRVQSAVTWWKVAIPLLTIIILFTKFHSGNFTVGGGFVPKGVTLTTFFQAIPGAGMVFAYLGFEQADQLAGEVKNPQRNLPLAILLAVGIGTVIYVLLQVVFIGATPPSALLHGGFAGISSTNQIAVAPFAGVAAAVGIGWLSFVLRLDGIISPSGTGLVYITSTSRVGYGLARNKYYPSIFQKTDKNGVPWFSLITAFVFGLVFTLPFPSWESLVGLITSASVLMYAGAPLALGVFRKELPDANRPFKMPGAVVVAPLAFVLASLIIDWSGFETLWKLGVAIILGYMLILMHFADNPNAPKIEWRRSAWIGAYLLGMGVISWQGQFGPENTGRLHFWWEFALVVVFSLGIYYWAQANSLKRDEILNVMAAQSVTSEPEEPAAA